MAKRSYPLSKVYGLLEPGPVVLVTTAHAGERNIMVMSWQTMLEFEPPLVACVISNRNHSFSLLEASGECAINIPTVELADKVVACGNCSGVDVDKFATVGLTPIAAALVGAPLVRECYAQLECKVVDTAMVAKYGLFVLQVVKAWRNTAIADPHTLHHMGYGRFMVGGTQIQLASKMR